MSLESRVGSNIIDYLMLLHRVNSELPNINKCVAVGFNKSEWHELLTLHNANYNDCRAFLNIATGNSTGIYSDIIVYWNGTNDESTYINSLHELKDMLRRHANPRDEAQVEPEYSNRVFNQTRNVSRPPRYIPQSLYYNPEATMPQTVATSGNF